MKNDLLDKQDGVEEKGEGDGDGAVVEQREVVER